MEVKACLSGVNQANAQCGVGNGERDGQRKPAHRVYVTGCVAMDDSDGTPAALWVTSTHALDVIRQIHGLWRNISSQNDSQKKQSMTDIVGWTAQGEGMIHGGGLAPLTMAPVVSSHDIHVTDLACDHNERVQNQVEAAAERRDVTRWIVGALSTAIPTHPRVS